MIKLIKPSGQEVEVNEHSLQAALDLGWKKVEPKPKPKAKPKK